MKSVREGVRRIVHAFDGLCGMILAIIVVLNLVAVFLRYVVFVPLSWSEEAIRYLSVWMTLVGSAAASWYDEHMDMNMFADMGGPTFQAWHKAVLHALTAVFAVFVTWQGTRYTMLNGMQTAPTSGLPMLYVYGALAVGGALMLVVSLVKILDCFVPPEKAETGTRTVL